MKFAQITFSPTGGTQKAADILTKGLDEAAKRIDLTDGNIDFEGIAFQREDAAVIAVPSYAGRVPALAAERLRKIRGNQARCVIVCTYGNRAYEDTLIELNDLAKESGFRVIGAVSAVTEHSIMRQYATGRPDRKDEAELREFAKRILKKIKDDAAQEEGLRLPGNHPYKKAGSGGFVPKAGKACTSCGLCAQKCPAQAISHEDNKLTDHAKCISCMRCVSICPQSARTLNKAMVVAASLALKKACSGRKENELFL